MEAKVLPTYVVEPMEAMGSMFTNVFRTGDSLSKSMLSATEKLRTFTNTSIEDIVHNIEQDAIIELGYSTDPAMVAKRDAIRDAMLKKMAKV